MRTLQKHMIAIGAVLLLGTLFWFASRTTSGHDQEAIQQMISLIESFSLNINQVI